MRPGRHLARVLAAPALWAALARAHVPTYSGDCEHNCCHPPHVHTTSQVVYLQGSGGIELDHADLNVAGDEIIEFSVVFAERYDPTTFQVFVGCGGCASDRSANPGEGWDPVNHSTNLLPVPMTYQHGELEPFTQTAYFALLPSGEQRLYHTKELEDCESPHWSLRILTHNNASENFRWGAVLGCEGFECEIFTAEEIVRFPIYVNANHGDTWNGIPQSLPIIAVVVAVLYLGFLYCGFGGWLFVYAPVSILPPRRVYSAMRDAGYDIRYWGRLPCVRWYPSLRCALYCIATYAMIVDLCETLFHFFYALRIVGAPGDAQGVGIFLGAVFLFGKVAPLLLVSFIWFYAREVPEFVWRTYDFRCVYACTGPRVWQGLSFYSPMWAHGGWSLLEIVGVGIAGFFWLGAGYFVFPCCMCIAGIVRCYTWLANPSGYYKGADGVFALNMNCPQEVTDELRAIYNSYYTTRERGRPDERKRLVVPEPAARPAADAPRRASAPPALPSAPPPPPRLEVAPPAPAPSYQYPDKNEPKPKFYPAPIPATLAEQKERQRELAEGAAAAARRRSQSASALPSLSNLFS